MKRSLLVFTLLLTTFAVLGGCDAKESSADTASITPCKKTKGGTDVGSAKCEDDTATSVVIASATSTASMTLATVCGRIERCRSGADAAICYRAGTRAKLFADAPTSITQACLADLADLPCSAPEMGAAWNASIPDEYANVSVLLNAAPGNCPAQ